METIDIILVFLFLIFLIFNLKVFFYQRTLRKISIKENIPQENLSCLYPKSYLVIYKISKLRWISVGALFYFNWIAALICIFIGFILPMILPEQDDYKNFEIARIALDNHIKMEIKNSRMPAMLDYKIQSLLIAYINEIN